jgi:hypothetical protein
LVLVAARMKGLVPLAVTIAVLAFIYVEVALNFTFTG